MPAPSACPSAGDALRIEQEGAAARSIPADRVLVATGRRARTAGFGLEQLDLTMNGPFVQIDERCATSMRNVWAVGDLTGEPMLAHRAMAQGVVVAKSIAGHRRVFDGAVIPAVCFTDPEIVTVGLSPDEARKAGHEVHTALFPFQANGRALTLGAEDGFVRVTARADNHLLLGLAAVGAGVSELSAAFGLALEMGARLEDVGGTIHAHPTLGEAFHEASLRALGEALHVEFESCLDFFHRPVSRSRAGIAGVADGPGDAVAIGDDGDAIAHLHVAVVILRDGDLLAVVPLHGDLDAPFGRAAAVDGGAGDGAADGAEQAADHGADHRIGHGRADRRTARRAQTAAHEGAGAGAGIAAADGHLANRDHAARIAAIAARRRRVDGARLIVPLLSLQAPRPIARVAGSSRLRSHFPNIDHPLWRDATHNGSSR